MGPCLYRDATFHCGVDTNNGTEALNKALKYSYLPRHHSLTLSQVAALPDAFQKYPFQNFKQTAFNRIYTLQKQVGCFNHRVVALVADKLERQWSLEVCFDVED